jgi:hypothetical protein
LIVFLLKQTQLSSSKLRMVHGMISTLWNWIDIDLVLGQILRAFVAERSPDASCSCNERAVQGYQPLLVRRRRDLHIIQHTTLDYYQSVWFALADQVHRVVSKVRSQDTIGGTRHSTCNNTEQQKAPSLSAL